VQLLLTKAAWRASSGTLPDLLPLLVQLLERGRMVQLQARPETQSCMTQHGENTDVSCAKQVFRLIYSVVVLSICLSPVALAIELVTWVPQVSL
jgi:hypothetical protein